MGGVLVLAGGVDDQLDAVVGGVGFEGRRRRPDVEARVRDCLGDRVQRNNVGAGSAQEHQRHGAGGCRVPGDGVGDADGDDLAETWSADGVAGGRVAHRLGVGRCQAEDGGGDESGDGETHCFRIILGYLVLDGFLDE